jgi:phenylacetic acid degradation protein
MNPITPQVYEIDGLRPVIAPGAYVHPSAVLIGDVIIGAGAYIGPCACLRGDFGRIIVEEHANVQDTCVMHGFPESDTIVAAYGHIGHGAVLHGCKVGRNALVGMNAVVMDFAEIGEEAIVAASAFVKAKFVVPARTLAMGSPAKIARELSAQEIAWKTEGTRTYIELAKRSLTTMRLTTALSEPEKDRKRIDFHDAVRPLSSLKSESNH